MDAITITLLEKPKMTIQKAEDGVWIHFKTAKGSGASINLANKFRNKKSMVDSIITEWAQEFSESSDIVAPEKEK